MNITVKTGKCSWRKKIVRRFFFARSKGSALARFPGEASEIAWLVWRAKGKFKVNPKTLGLCPKPCREA